MIKYFISCCVPSSIVSFQGSSTLFSYDQKRGRISLNAQDTLFYFNHSLCKSLNCRLQQVLKHIFDHHQKGGDCWQKEGSQVILNDDQDEDKVFNYANVIL